MVIFSYKVLFSISSYHSKSTMDLLNPIIYFMCKKRSTTIFLTHENTFIAFSHSITLMRNVCINYTHLTVSTDLDLAKL